MSVLDRADRKQPLYWPGPDLRNIDTESGYLRRADARPVRRGQAPFVAIARGEVATSAPHRSVPRQRVTARRRRRKASGRGQGLATLRPCVERSAGGVICRARSRQNR